MLVTWQEDIHIEWMIYLWYDIRAYIHTYVYVYIRICIYAYMYVHTYIHTYTHIHTYIHTHTHAYIYTCTYLIIVSIHAFFISPFWHNVCIMSTEVTRGSWRYSYNNGTNTVLINSVYILQILEFIYYCIVWQLRDSELTLLRHCLRCVCMSAWGILCSQSGHTRWTITLPEHASTTTSTGSEGGVYKRRERFWYVVHARTQMQSTCKSGLESSRSEKVGMSRTQGQSFLSLLS